MTGLERKAFIEALKKWVPDRSTRAAIVLDVSEASSPKQSMDTVNLFQKLDPQLKEWRLLWGNKEQGIVVRLGDRLPNFFGTGINYIVVGIHPPGSKVGGDYGQVHVRREQTNRDAPLPEPIVITSLEQHGLAWKEKVI